MREQGCSHFDRYSTGQINGNTQEELVSVGVCSMRKVAALTRSVCDGALWRILRRICKLPRVSVGESPSGKATGSEPVIRGFESLLPSHEPFTRFARSGSWQRHFLLYKCEWFMNFKSV